jgi:hypothetical protein
MRWLTAAVTAGVLGIGVIIAINREDIARYIQMRQM